MPIASDPNWTDIGGFVAAAVGVIITFGAVLVALFGPRYNAWRRRPKLGVKSEPSTVSWSPYGSIPAHVMYLSIHNEDGSDTARDVEVFVDAHAIDMPELRRSTGPTSTSMIRWSKVPGVRPRRFQRATHDVSASRLSASHCRTRRRLVMRRGSTSPCIHRAGCPWRQCGMASPTRSMSPSRAQTSTRFLPRHHGHLDRAGG
jgi:hypothetical protein